MICKFHCFTVHFVSQSFICTNLCTCFYVTLKSLKTLLLKINEEVNERVPDDDLERSKHVKRIIFNKSVLSDFSVT